MARRLVEVGVNFVQVNLGNNGLGLARLDLPTLGGQPIPPRIARSPHSSTTLQQTGMFDRTMIVMAGEFGRTPRISALPQHYRLPGRDR